LTFALLALAGFFAGAMNAVAGGGSFLTFPALVFTGVPSIVANASSTVALFPGSFASAWAYRDRFRNFDGISLPVLLTVSLAGGATGAILLLTTSQRTFDVVIPWLLLAASIIFALGPRIAPQLSAVISIGPRTLLALQFIVSIYGGYFGGAVGIVSMALWSLLGRTDVHEMNAAKTLLVGTMNTAAVVIFVIAGKVWWPETLTMMAGAIAGGYFGAVIARRLSAKLIRTAVIVISFGVTAAFFLR
jgi:uncharacterized membrane protein YfcA